MPRRFIFAASLALLTGGASQLDAQAARVTPRPSFGVLAGLNIATLSGSDVEGASSRLGFIGGGYADFHFAGSGFGIEPELLYSMQGAKTSGEEASLELSYLQIPVLFRYDFPTTSKARPFVVAGPSIGIKIGCNVSGQGVSVDCDTVNLQTTGFDLGGTLGAGVGFKLGKQTASLGARYTIGTNDIFENNFKAKSRFWSILAGFGF